MLKAINSKDDLVNLKATDDGALLVTTGGEEGGVEVVQTTDKEIVLNCSILTLNTETQVVEINKKVTQISIANYSETADITLTIADKIHQIGNNLVIDLPINLDVENISLVSTEDNTKIQLLIKGVE